MSTMRESASRRPSAIALTGAALLGVALLAAGCGSGPERVALERPAQPAPDNAARLPLSTPPVYWVRPGADGPRQDARARYEEPPPVRTGEDALLRSAGARQTDADIRQDLGRGPGYAVLPARILERLLALGTGSLENVPRPVRARSRPLGEEE
jgi:hypothetical protein